MQIARAHLVNDLPLVILNCHIGERSGARSDHPITIQAHDDFTIRLHHLRPFAPRRTVHNRKRRTFLESLRTGLLYPDHIRPERLDSQFLRINIGSGFLSGRGGKSHDNHQAFH